MHTDFFKNLPPRNAFTLLELSIAIIFLAVVLVALLYSYSQSIKTSTKLQRINQALVQVRKEMESIKNMNFADIPSLNNTSFQIENSDFENRGVIYVENFDTDTLRIILTVCLKDVHGRVIGEDKDLDGVLDPGEDIDGDGRISSPVSVETLIYGGQ